MSTRLFLGHLGPGVQERDIEDFFRGFGKLRDVVLKNGFGFVELEDPRDARDAIRELDGKVLCDSRQRGGGSGSRNGGGGGFSSSRDRPFGGSAGFSNNRDRSFGGGYREGNRNFGGEKRERSPVLSHYNHRLIIENLTTRVDWQELKKVFADCYPVFADAHKKERNIGVVCFSCQSDLKRALEKYQGKELNGREIKLIDDSRHSSPSPRARRGRSRSTSPVKTGRVKRSNSRSMSRSKSPRGSPVKSGRVKRSHSRSVSRSKSPRGSPVKSGRGKRSNSRSMSRSKSPRGSPVKSGRAKRSHSRSVSRTKSPRGSPVKSGGYEESTGEKVRKTRHV